jgi:hypothetical protein
MQISLSFMGLLSVPCEFHDDETLITTLFIIIASSHQICLCGTGFNIHEMSHDTQLWPHSLLSRLSFSPSCPSQRLLSLCSYSPSLTSSSALRDIGRASHRANHPPATCCYAARREPHHHVSVLRTRKRNLILTIRAKVWSSDTLEGVWIPHD